MMDRSYRRPAGEVGGAGAAIASDAWEAGVETVLKGPGRVGCGTRQWVRRSAEGYPRFAPRDSTLTKLWQNALFQENFGDPGLAGVP
jgi:hypothetical protein